jgi:hypothetical protein
MASSYRGIYVQRYADGIIHNVQVEAPGTFTPMDPTTYVRRGIQPPMDSLPDVEDYLKKSASMVAKKAANIGGRSVLPPMRLKPSKN